MDQSFLFRAQRALSGHRRARLEHDMLVAAVAARQSASATALRQTAAAGPVTARDGAREEPLVELLLAGPEWRKACLVQAGRFSHRPGQAANQVPDKA